MLNLFFPEKHTVIVGLEIGTAKVAAVVGEVTEAGGVNVIGIGQCPSRGVRKGEVVNADLAAEDVRNAVVEAEKSADVALVAPAARAAAMACRASLISCTGAPAHPARQATPTNTARRRSIGFSDTSNSRQSRQTSRRYTMRDQPPRIRCVDAARVQEP